MSNTSSDGNFRLHLGGSTPGEITPAPDQDHNNWTKIRTLSSDGSTVKMTPVSRKDDTYVDGIAIDAKRNSDADNGTNTTVIRSDQMVQYKVYKRRWFGLVQLVLLNIIVSWDVSYWTHIYISKWTKITAFI